MEAERHIILFDGVCNLCNRSVQSVIRKDKKGIFKFASLQSDAGKELLKEIGLPSDNLHSFVYIKNNSFYIRSDAALQVAKTLGGGWKALSYFKVVPRVIRDFFYNTIAKNRYKWFGKKDKCMVPSPELRARFL